MKWIFSLLLLWAVSADAKYLDSESCNECHEKIYAEHAVSMHHKSSLFKDEVHRKVKEKVNKEKYACALCHMPATKNLSSMIRGMEQPNPKSKRQQDGVSCFYCHQINRIYHGTTYNINFYSYKTGVKPKFMADLDNPDSSDKHDSESNEIFKNSEVCMGCHSHKQNQHAFEVCNAQDAQGATSDCIGCHMPKDPGGAEKYNKRGRDQYATHKFLGIHSPEMVKRAVELKLTQTDGDGIDLEIINKMGHPIITQPMRLKFVKTIVIRDGKTIWSNFKKSPIEDKEATFIIVFKDKEGKPAMPQAAVGYKIKQNLPAMQSKTVHYGIQDLKEGDRVEATWISYIINPKIAKKLKITDKALLQAYKGASISLRVK